MERLVKSGALVFAGCNWKVGDEKVEEELSDDEDEMSTSSSTVSDNE